MDETLEKRWKTSASPFDGQCLRLVSCIELQTLRPLLQLIVRILHERSRGQALYRFDDWHQHDGYVTQANPTDWSALETMLISDKSLHNSRHGDDWVRLAFYPADLSFLLRLFILDFEEEPVPEEPHGDFDLCATAEMLDAIRSTTAHIATGLEVVDAKTHFDRIYAG